MGDEGLEPVAQNPTKTVRSANSAAESGAVGADSSPISPELAEVIDAWEALPKAIKAGILAMVRASGELTDADSATRSHALVRPTDVS